MTTFENTGLSQEILDAISDLGFIDPTPIQKKTIPLLMSSDNDLIACAQTGTGKTAAFGLPLIHHTNMKSKQVQTLILSPTRELCLQIAKDMENYSKHTEGFHVIPVYGGASIENQIAALRRGGQVVVGTPGRTLDLIKRKKLLLSEVKWLVLDEADEMLSMGFKDDLESILSATPDTKQTLLFSATMPDDIIGMAKKYMHNPVEISVGDKNASTDHVIHEYYVAHAKDRYVALKRITDVHPDIYAIIFCRTRSETREIAEKLSHDGYNADALHGDLSQAQRDYVMSRFRNKQLQLLVATDVAARGLDVHSLSHIINYTLPEELDVYVHRSGRTGRADQTGVSISIINTREIRQIHLLERRIGKKMELKKIPSGKDICEKQLYKLIDKVENVKVNESEIEEYLPAILKKLDWLDREELIKHFVSVEFNRFLTYYENTQDINADVEKSDRRDKTFTKFFLNIGSKNNVQPKVLLGLINQYVPERNIEIGKIDIQRSFSFFEAEESYRSMILESFKNATYRGMQIVIEISDRKATKQFDGKRHRQPNRQDFNPNKKIFQKRNFRER